MEQEVVEQEQEVVEHLVEHLVVEHLVEHLVVEHLVDRVVEHPVETEQVVERAVAIMITNFPTALKMEFGDLSTEDR